MESTRTTTLKIVDARDIDGTPYEAASAAFKNLDSILLAADQALDAVDVLALNVDMQRTHDTTGFMDPEAYYSGLLCKRLVGIREGLVNTRRAAEVLRRAATFDPRASLDRPQ